MTAFFTFLFMDLPSCSSNISPQCDKQCAHYVEFCESIHGDAMKRRVGLVSGRFWGFTMERVTPGADLECGVVAGNNQAKLNSPNVTVKRLTECLKRTLHSIIGKGY